MSAMSPKHKYETSHFCVWPVFTLGSGQHCAYVLVRFQYKDRLIRVRKTCFGPKLKDI